MDFGEGDKVRHVTFEQVDGEIDGLWGRGLNKTCFS